MALALGVREAPLMRTVRMQMLALLLSLGGCGSSGDIEVSDSRFATPERTVRTLLGAYGIADVPQDELRAHLASGRSFELGDPETHRRCFVDLDRPGGEGMAGYVLGMLAAARDELRFETVEDHGFVFPREGVRVVMRRDSGAYRIVLEESVPDDVRRRLAALEARAEERARRGIPIDSP